MREKLVLSRLTASCSLFLLVLGGAPSGAAPVSGGNIALVQVATGLDEPIGVTNAGDGSGRLFIVEREGRIRIWQNGQLLATPFLNITTLVGCSPNCGERGLLGLAFHPDYESNGDFFVFHSQSDGDLRLARYNVSSGNPNAADSASRAVLLTIEHSSQSNHNGGHLAFGPDGYLYISVGDGGGGGDPFENGQNTSTLLGKILRLDVDSDAFPADPNRNYAIPGGNPFAGATPGADEVWDYGLRNPWRFSFDRVTGDLYIGDVGQQFWEEINFEPANTGGVDYGWDCREGAHDYNDPERNSTGCSDGSTDPVLEYSHSPDNCSVTGGYVYRGGVPSFLTGQYLYGDFCSGRIWRGSSNGSAWSSMQMTDTSFGISSFGESETGRIYFTDLFGNTLQWIAPYTFQDVQPSYWAWPQIEALFTRGITTGCSDTGFCPLSLVTRAEMAVFLVRALRGSGFTPPPAAGIFADVPTTYWAAPWIEQLYADGITTGCASSPRRYCPEGQVTRAEMAVFLLRTKHGAGYTPPDFTTSRFADVPTSYWAHDWIEQLYTEGISTGCGASPLRYCPESSIRRDEMAAFLARTLALPLP
ncbi:MAG TPA: PQQ-dependent sugar dehydrogenase [Thermoanaerobaculia bacterium]